MPKISVITATYNRASILPRALNSVQQQTFDDYEHIVVDDGSTDDTEQVVRDHAHDRLRYFRLEENQGPATAWNHGIRKANGEYISILDSDDMYLQERLERTNDVLDSQPLTVGGVFHGFYQTETTDEQGTRCSVREGKVTRSDLAVRNPTRGHSNLLYRATVFEQVDGYDEDLVSAIDYDFLLRTAEQFDWVGIDEPLLVRKESTDGIQNDPAKVRRGQEQFLAKHEDILTPEAVAKRHRRAGTACLQLGERESARAHFEKCIERGPPERRAGLHQMIGLAYLEHDHKRKARHHFGRALRRGSLDLQKLVLLGITLFPVSGGTSYHTLKHLRDTLQGSPTG